MTNTKQKLLACWLTTLIVGSVTVALVSFSMSGVVVAANTVDSGSVSLSGSANVDVSYNTIRSGGNTDADIQVEYDASGSVSDAGNVGFAVINLDSQSVIEHSATGVDSTSGTATLSLNAGNVPSNDFTGEVQLQDIGDIQNPTVIGKDSAPFYVRDLSNPPAVDFSGTSMRPYTNQTIAVAFDSDGISKNNLELRLYNESNNARLLNTVDLSGSTDTGGIRVPLSAGGAGSGSFNARVELWDTSQGTEVAGTTQSITVGNPSVTLNQQDYDDNTVDVTYSTAGTSATRYDLFLFDTEGQIGKKSNVASGTNKKVTFSSVDGSSKRSAQAVLIADYSNFIASDTACLYAGNNNCAGVTSTSIEYADGTSVSDKVSLDTTTMFGMTQLVLHENGDASNQNLSTINNFDTSRDLWINFSLKNTGADVLMGNADVKKWLTPSVDSTSKVRIKVTPTQVFRNETIQTRDPDRWPTSTGVATNKRTQVRLSTFKFQGAGGASDLAGAYLASDAQVFRPPQFVNGDTIRLPAASPHFEPDGTTQNTGFYTAYIPSAMVDRMGLPNPTGMTVGGLGSGGSITEQDGGALIEANLHYSSGNIDISPDNTDPTADASSTGTSAKAGSSVTLDGSASSDNSAIETYEWDVDGDSNYEKSTSSATIDYTFSNSGDKDVTLRVTDGNSNTDTDSVTISVESQSSGGGGGSGASGSSVEPIPPGSEDDTDGSGTKVTINRVEIGDPIEVTPKNVGTETVSVDEVTAEFSTGTNIDNEMEISASRSPPSQVPEPQTGSVNGYINVDIEGILADDVSGGSFTFTMKENLPEDPTAVSVKRYNDEEWQDVTTTHLGSGQYKVETPGYSSFAVTVTDEQTDTETETTTTTAAPTEITESTTTIDTETETVTSIKEASTTTRQSTGTTPGAGPGFGVVTTLIALIGSSLAIGRW